MQELNDGNTCRTPGAEGRHDELSSATAEGKKEAGASGARSAEGTRPASGHPLEEQPEAKQPATKQTETITSPQSSRDWLAKIREKAQKRGGGVRAGSAGVTGSGDVELVVAGRTSEGTEACC